MTIAQALELAAHKLAGRRPTAEQRARASRDAELLLLNALNIPRSTLLAHPNRELTVAELAHYQHNVRRRGHNEPIQYITGTQEFYGLTLRVTPAVLIPRPETEHLVEAVLHFIAAARNLGTAEPPNHILDIGTGSGAIIIALATHLPQAQLTAVDLSHEAILVAQHNARANNVDDRIHFLHSDLLTALPPDKSTGHFDIIVSNPPYIPTEDAPTLHAEVRDHEPHTALFAGPQGLDIYRRLIPQARAALKPNGLLALEIGHGQREPLADLLADWHDIKFIKDLQQIPRVVLAQRPA